jgi:hypothetical protein
LVLVQFERVARRPAREDTRKMRVPHQTEPVPDSLVLYAGIHPIHFGFHRMLSKRFPFGIYYEVEHEVAYVYAILDMRRDPLWRRSELQKRT